MKLSYNILKEFVDLDVTPQKLAELLTLKAAEVEDVQEFGQDISKVVVGEILEIRPHPKADKLQIAKVSVGADTLEIVCGAPNIQVGQKVPTALIGAVLPGNFKITKREIRGVESEGMLASGKELGVSEDATGIMILDPKLEVGSSVTEVTGLADAVLDVAVLPDRSYLLSHIGAAREIAAIREKQISLDTYGAEGNQKISGSTFNNEARVSILDPGLCPRYSMIVLQAVKIEPSPAWLQIRLERLGVRSVNNIVDLTNYVMMELGQPLHAFDADKLSSKKINVRPAKPKEKIKTLDGESRILDEEILVIADDKNPIAIAGVMGGQDSEISNKTHTVILESANFDPISIRKTAQKLKLSSEASMRFERGVDPNLTTVALARLVELLPQVGMGDVKTSRLVDEYPAPLVRQPIRFQPALVKKLTSVDVSTAKQVQILESLGASINESVEGNQEDLLVTPPSYRLDLNIPADLVEEVIRLHGYDKVPLTLPQTDMLPQPIHRDRHWAKKIKNILRGAGYTEIETYSFSSKRELVELHFDPRQHLELENPISPDQAYMRSTLLPNSLAVVKKNIDLGLGAMRFFELGRTYRLVRDQDYPYEGLRLLIVEVGAHSPQSNPDDLSNWQHLSQVLNALVFHLGLNINDLNKKPFIANKAYHHGRTAQLTINEEDIGYLAEVHPISLTRLDIDRRVTVLDLDFQKLIELSQPYREYQEVPRVPSVTRDLSVLVDANQSVNELMEVMQKAGGPQLNQLEFFDKFVSDTLGENKKSLSFHLSFLDPKKTLQEKDIEPLLSKIDQALSNLGAKIRG